MTAPLYWVVREGKIPGAGSYLQDNVKGPLWGSRKGAAVYRCREDAPVYKRSRIVAVVCKPKPAPPEWGGKVRAIHLMTAIEDAAFRQAEDICRRVAREDERLSGRKDSAALACADRIAFLRGSR